MYTVILASVLATTGGSSPSWHRSHGAGGGYNDAWYFSPGYNGCYGGFNGAGLGGGGWIIQHGGWGYSCSGGHGCFGGYQSLACTFGCPGIYASERYSTSIVGNGNNIVIPPANMVGVTNGVIVPVTGYGFEHGYKYWGGSPSGAYAPYGWYNGWRPYMEVGCFQCHGCYGTYTGWGCSRANIPGMVLPPGNVLPPPQQEQGPPPKNNEPQTLLEPNKSLVVVEIPENAKLYIDGAPTRQTTGRRTFTTPELAAGKTYYYELTAELVKDGKTVSQSQRVLLIPGKEVNASFLNMESASVIPSHGSATLARDKY